VFRILVFFKFVFLGFKSKKKQINVFYRFYTKLYFAKLQIFSVEWPLLYQFFFKGEIEKTRKL